MSEIQKKGTAAISNFDLPDSNREILDELKLVDQQRRMGKHDNHLPIVDVKIPPSELIECPLTRPNVRQALQCKSCNNYRGVVQKAWDDKHVIPWSGKYAIRCGFILERRTISMVIGQ